MKLSIDIKFSFIVIYSFVLLIAQVSPQTGLRSDQI